MPPMTSSVNETYEVLLSSDDSSPTVSIWDLKTGSSIGTLKGGAPCSPAGLARAANSYIISATPKPVLNVIPISGGPGPLRQTLPGGLPATAVACSPDSQSKFFAAAVGDGIYLWQTSSGKLLGVLTGGHFQSVTRLVFAENSTFLISGAKDGNAAIWSTNLADKPFRVFNLHSLEITDLSVIRNRLFTCSRDQTVKITDFLGAGVVLEVTFSTPLTAICADDNEVHVGTGSGKIHCFSLKDPPRGMTLSLTPERENTYAGQTRESAISSLCRSLDGTMIVSGASDGIITVWDVRTRSALRTMKHGGSVTNLMIVMNPVGSLGSFLPDRNRELRPTVSFSQLEKTKRQSTKDDELCIFTRHEIPSMFEDDKEDDYSGDDFEISRPVKSLPGQESGEEVAKLKEINLELYHQALKLTLMK